MITGIDHKINLISITWVHAEFAWKLNRLLFKTRKAITQHHQY